MNKEVMDFLNKTIHNAFIQHSKKINHKRENLESLLLLKQLLSCISNYKDFCNITIMQNNINVSFIDKEHQVINTTFNINKEDINKNADKSNN